MHTAACLPATRIATTTVQSAMMSTVLSRRTSSVISFTYFVYIFIQHAPFWHKCITPGGLPKQETLGNHKACRSDVKY